MSTLDVEKIMQEIRQNIFNKKLICDVPPAEDILCNSVIYNKEMFELNNEVGFLHQKAVIPAWRVLYSRYPVVGHIVIFIKKVLRKLIKFYVEPITQDQSEWNIHCAHALLSVEQLIEDKDEEIAALRAKLKQQEEQQIKLELQLAELNKKLGAGQ